MKMEFDCFQSLCSSNHLVGFINWWYFFLFFKAAPGTYGRSQVRGQIRAAAEAYSTACDNARCLIHWDRPRIKPTSSKITSFFFFLNPVSHNGNSYKVIIFFYKNLLKMKNGLNNAAADDNGSKNRILTMNFFSFSW